MDIIKTLELYRDTEATGVDVVYHLEQLIKALKEQQEEER